MEVILKWYSFAVKHFMPLNGSWYLRCWQELRERKMWDWYMQEWPLTRFDPMEFIRLYLIMQRSWENVKGTFCLFSPVTDGHYTGTPPTYGYDADRAEEQRRHHDILPYIDDSPSSSPHLSSKSRSSRDTLSSGSLESSKSVSIPPDLMHRLLLLEKYSFLSMAEMELKQSRVN